MPMTEADLPLVPERYELASVSELERALGGRRLILASASPRRRDLLRRTGLRFEVQPADIPEEREAGEVPGDFAKRLALEKAQAIALRDGPGALVLGADTIVVIGDEVLGKPRDASHAEELLASILGREHCVITAFAVVDRASGCARAEAAVSRVQMRSAERAELRAYIATGESLDKAGAYALQGEGRKFVTAVDGSATNVIGLPVEETLELLGEVARESA